MARTTLRALAVGIASRRRIASCAALAAIATALALALSPAVSAQNVNNDYYRFGGTELLRNVESYHLAPAHAKYRARQYQSGHSEVMFMLNYFPNHPQALMLLVDYCEVWKSPLCDVQQAIENAIAVNPTAPTTYVIQGIYLYRTKMFPASIAALEKALKLDPNSVNGHYNLGLAYFETKQYDLANAHAQRADQLGAAVPGLRDKLMRAGQWKPVNPAATDGAPKRADAPPATTAR